MFRYKAYQLQGAQYARFQTNRQWQATISMVPQYVVGSVVDVAYVQ
jgi:hypothetical protein